MMMKTIAAFAAALALSGCAGLLGGRAPPELLTLSAAQNRPTAPRAAPQGAALTVVVPTVPEALRTPRIPVRINETSIQYLQNAQWVEPPAALFRRVVEETIAARTGRVVLDPRQFTHDPGDRLTGQLQEFGLDAVNMQVVAIYDAAIAAGAGPVRSRRFEARVPVAEATSAQVAPALNQAANLIAAEVAAWVGG